MIPKLANRFNCTACLACVDACPVDALRVIINGDGHFYVKCEKKICIKCKICENVCPYLNRMVYGTNNKKSVPYTAWCKDDNLRNKSASGGIFAAIAKSFLMNNDYIAGAVIDGLKIKHILTNDINELEKIQGSKYLQSNTQNVYRQINNVISDHKVLFSGTGCQVAGLISYIKKMNPLYLNNLYTIDIVCDGVPSYKLFEKLIENYPQKIDTIISFRDKSKGWNNSPKTLKVESCNEIIDFGFENLFISGFNMSLSNRFSCFNCKFAYSDRISDITIADFWGIEKYRNEHFKGVSLLIIHNKKGQELIDNSLICYNKTQWEDAVKTNFRVINGLKKGYKYNFARIFQSYIFAYCSYNTIIKFYWNGIGGKTDFLWVPYYLYIKLLMKIKKISIVKKYKKFINM